MVPERDVDCGELYSARRRELLDRLEALRAGDLFVTVPATPAWTVHDVLCHLVGITADMNAGNFGSGDPDGWTDAQVRSRRSHSVSELDAEWDSEAPKFEEGLRSLGYEIGSHYVADLLQHTADIHHALGLAPPRDDLGLAVALDFYLISFEQALRRSLLGSVAITVRPEAWTLGEGELIASVEAGRYELFRALGGRRSESQIRALTWTGDVAAILPVVSRYPLPSEPI
jgi:uncharacterized protein (TIGR03083 family)